MGEPKENEMVTVDEFKSLKPGDRIVSRAGLSATILKPPYYEHGWYALAHFDGDRKSKTFTLWPAVVYSILPDNSKEVDRLVSRMLEVVDVIRIGVRKPSEGSELNELEFVYRRPIRKHETWLVRWKGMELPIISFVQYSVPQYTRSFFEANESRFYFILATEDHPLARTYYKGE